MAQSTLNVTVPGSAFCAGNNQIQIPVSYSDASATYLPGNVFHVQLSNAQGTFSNPLPVNIGSLSSQASSGTIQAFIPAWVQPGSNYRVRIVASSPYTIGNDNGTDLRVDNTPQVSVINSLGLICQGNSVQLSATGAADFSWSPAATLSSATGAVVTAMPTVPTTYTVTGTNTCGTSSTTAFASASQVLFREAFGSPFAYPVTIFNYQGYDNNNLGFYGSGFISGYQNGHSSSGYPGASGGPNIKLWAMSGGTQRNFGISNISILGHTTLQLSFGIRKSTTTSNGTQAQVKLIMNNFIQTVNVPALPTGAGTAKWYYVTLTFTPPVTGQHQENVQFNFTNTSTNTEFLFDDIMLANPSALPVVNPVGPVNVCTGTTLALTAGTATSYSWSNGATTQVNLVNQSGSYTVTTTDVTGCTRTSAPVIVNMTGPTVPVLSNNGPICVGQTLQLSATGNPALSYTWYKGHPSWATPFSNSQNPTIPNATIQDAGMYYMTVIVPGCGVIADSMFANIGAQNFTLTTNSNTPVCEGQTLGIGAYSQTLTGASFAASNYTWTGPNGFTSSQAYLTFPNAMPAHSGLYTVSATTACGTATNTIAVQVNPVPAAPQPTNSSPVCMGQPIQLSANGNYPAGTLFSWSPYASTVGSIQQNPVVTASYLELDMWLTVTVDGCVSQPGSTTLTASWPNSTLYPSSNAPVCSGETLNLTANYTNNGSYSWAGPNGFTAAGNIVSIPNLQPINFGTYTATGGAPGCLSTGTINVGLPAGPWASSNSPICPGAHLSLYADTLAAGTSYSWSGPNGFTSTLQNPVLPTITTADAGNYTVYANLGNCLSAPTIVPVSITNNVTLNVTGNTTLNQGSTLYLHAAGPAGNYTWTGPNGFTGVGPNIYIQNITPANAGNYTVTFDAPGCNLGTAVTTVTVNPLISISGMVYNDLNNNGTQDSGESGLSGMLVELQPGNYFAYTDSLGNYSAFVSTDTVVVSLANLQSNQNSTPTTVVVVLAGSQTSPVINFGVHSSSVNNLHISVAEVECASPGFVTQHRITYKNLGTTPRSGTVRYKPDSQLTLNGSTTAGYTLNGDTLVWSYSNLQPNQTAYKYVYLNVPATLALGDSLSSFAAITPVGNDSSPADNYFTLAQTVVGAFDPNDKLVQPAGPITLQDIANGQDLVYTIRFQNTGTAPAANVLLVDTLSANLDWSTFEMLSASHNYHLSMRNQGILEWHFPNIMLPDSGTSQTASQGNVQYRILPKSSLVTGDNIFNTAHIFFDFNEAVVTNTTQTPVGILATPDARNLSLLQVYPNPNNGQATVKFTAANPAETTVSVLNLLGQEVLQLQKVTDAGEVEIPVDLQQQPAGIYLVRVQQNGKVYSAKLIRQ